MTKHVVKRYVSQVRLLTAQKPKTRPVGGKESWPYFRCRQLVEESGGHLSKGRLPPTPCWQAGGESCYRQSQGLGGHRQKEHSHLWSHPELSSAVWPASSWSFQVQLVFSPGRTCSISLWSVLGTGAARVLGTVWSSLANSSTWGFSICKTAHTMWLRVWSVALEKELKVPDGAYWLLLFSLLRLFSFVAAFLTSLIKLNLWQKFSMEKRQAGDTVGGQGSWSPALFQMEVKLRFSGVFFSLKNHSLHCRSVHLCSLASQL